MTLRKLLLGTAIALAMISPAFAYPTLSSGYVAVKQSFTLAECKTSLKQFLATRGDLTIQPTPYGYFASASLVPATSKRKCAACQRSAWLSSLPLVIVPVLPIPRVSRTSSIR
jgi:hypothetical protein